MVKLWIEEMGTMWLADGGVCTTRRFVTGQAVKRTPSRGGEFEMVVRRILYGERSARIPL